MRFCSAIQLPESTYPLWDALPPAVVADGKLSRLQLEGVLYACTKHQQLLPTGEREPHNTMRPDSTYDLYSSVTGPDTHSEQQPTSILSMRALCMSDHK